MVTGQKPNLTGIQRFSATAYVKLENTGKLDKCASKGCFVGYDSESKGYQIYWPEKRTVSIKQNVVFNPEDSFEESVEIMNEGENEKIFQNLTEKPLETTTENLNGQNSTKNLAKKDSPEDPNPPDYTAEPINEHPCCSHLQDVLPEPEPNTRCSFRAQWEPGAYRRLNQGLDANIAFIDDLDDELEELGWTDHCNLAKIDGFKLPDSWVLAGSMDEEPASLQEALEGLDGAEWKRGLDKEIGRLEAAKTWRVVKPLEVAGDMPRTQQRSIKPEI